MESKPNPYAPPQSSTPEHSTVLPVQTRFNSKRKMAIAVCLFSALIASLFTVVDDVVVQARIGPWPIIFVSAFLSLLSAFLTKDQIFAPLTCFAAIMCSTGIVALTHSLQFAQLQLAVPIALAFSAPALLTAYWRSRGRAGLRFRA